MKSKSILFVTAVLILLLLFQSVAAVPPSVSDKDLVDLAEQLIAKLPKTERQKVAVLDFADLNGKVADFGQDLAEELTMQLIDNGGCDVIERRLAGKIARDNNINLAEAVDPETAKNLGKYSARH